MEYRSLGKTGLKVSALGFGASPLGSVFEAIDESEGERSVRLAIELGINFFDVSPYYGSTRAETVLGRALRGIPRDRYILATKVGRYGNDTFDFSAARVTRSVDESLERLGVEHVDLIQCHDIEFGNLDQVIDETLPALREVVKRGKARFIGITGLPLKIFTTVLARAEVDTVLSYCHYALNDTSLMTIMPLLKEKQVGVISASPLSMGLLSRRGAPAWHPAPMEIKQACAAANRAAESRGVDISRLAVQFALANRDIATTLVGMASCEHVRRNIEAMSEPIDMQALRDVSEVLAPVKDRAWVSGRRENN
jgi:L-galactose dehydrogenase